MEYISYINLPICLIALCFAWRNVNARWFLISLAAIELVDLGMLPIVQEWRTHYYLWAVFMNILFFMVVLGRMFWARQLYKLTGSKYFIKLRQEYQLSQQEAAICFLFLVSLIINLLVWFEILMYVNFVIDTPYLYSYVLNPIQSVLHILECLAVMTFITRLPKSDKRMTYDYSN